MRLGLERLNLPHSKKKFAHDLYMEIEGDNIFNGAAALAYYLFLAIFPAMIFLLSLLPYLPIADLHQAVMEALRQAIPGEAAKALEGVIAEVTKEKRGGLLSLGLFLTLWTASSGFFAIMQQLNITYDVKESRPFWKTRGLAMLLTIAFALLVAGAFALIVLGGVLQGWLGDLVGYNQVLLISFSLLRWFIILLLLLMGFALTYFFGPDVEQEFRFISPGSLLGTGLLILGSLAFRIYVENFGNYSATYGGLGAVIILMVWLYVAGFVILLGSELNALIEHYSLYGKRKGQKEIPRNVLGHKDWMWSRPQTVRSSLRGEQVMRVSQEASEGAAQKGGTGGAVDLLIGVVALILAARKGRSDRKLVNVSRS